MIQWSREGLAWVAGLFEGEGCIALTKKRTGVNHNQWWLVVASTDEDVLRRFHLTVGLGHITGPTRRGEYKPVWTWRCGKREHVYALLVALYPWLGERRQERAREALGGIANTPTYESRRCEQGHPWNPRSTGQRRHDGGSRVVCLECYSSGVISHRMAA